MDHDFIFLGIWVVGLLLSIIDRLVLPSSVFCHTLSYISDFGGRIDAVLMIWNEVDLSFRLYYVHWSNGERLRLGLGLGLKF